MDPSNVLTAAQVEKELLRLADELAGPVLEELAVASEDAARAETSYKVAFAKYVLASEYKTQRDREHDATVRCADLLFKYRAGENLVKTLREKCSAYRSSIDALRTIAANVREQTR